MPSMAACFSLIAPRSNANGDDVVVMGVAIVAFGATVDAVMALCTVVSGARAEWAERSWIDIKRRMLKLRCEVRMI